MCSEKFREKKEDERRIGGLVLKSKADFKVMQAQAHLISKRFFMQTTQITPSLDYESLFTQPRQCEWQGGRVPQLVIPP